MSGAMASCPSIAVSYGVFQKPFAAEIVDAAHDMSCAALKFLTDHMFRDGKRVSDDVDIYSVNVPVRVHDVLVRDIPVTNVFVCFSLLTDLGRAAASFVTRLSRSLAAANQVHFARRLQIRQTLCTQGSRQDLSERTPLRGHKHATAQRSQQHTTACAAGRTISRAGGRASCSPRQSRAATSSSAAIQSRLRAGAVVSIQARHCPSHQSRQSARRF